MVLALLGAIAIWAFYRQPPLGSKNSEPQEQWIFSAFVLALTFSTLLSSYYPWYYSWLALFLCFVPNSAALALTLITWPLYRSLFDQSADDLFRFQSRVCLPFFALLVLMWIMGKGGSRTNAGGDLRLESGDADVGGTEAGPHPGNPCESSQTPRWRLQSFRHFQRNDSRDIPYRRNVLSRRL